MNKQPEALRLADELYEAAEEYYLFDKDMGYGAAAELRRLHEVNAVLLDACKLIDSLHPEKDSATDWNIAFNKVHAAVVKATGEQQ